MNIAERIVAGPPVLATVGRGALLGDVVYHLDEEDVCEVLEARPAIVGGPPGLRLRSLYTGEEYDAQRREVAVLTKAEAAEARKHIAENWSA